jgi:hypothetical protein
MMRSYSLLGSATRNISHRIRGRRCRKILGEVGPSILHGVGQGVLLLKVSKLKGNRGKDISINAERLGKGRQCTDYENATPLLRHFQKEKQRKFRVLSRSGQNY